MTFLGIRPSTDAALIDAATGASTSFRQLLDDMSGVGASIARSDKGLVFVRMRNDRFSVTAYLGAQLAGHAVALLDGARPLVEMGDILLRYGPDVVTGPLGTAAELTALGYSVSGVEAFMDGEVVTLSAPAPAALHPDLALLLSTSGTTGSGKFVRLSRRSVEANARSIAECLGIRPTDRPITSLPIHYSFGLSVLNSHLSAGAAVVLTAESVLQQSFWEALRERRCTTFAAVPYTFRILEGIGYRQMDLPDLLTMQQAGGALDRSLTERYERHMRTKGGRLFVMYGQTEATARIAYVPAERLPHKLGSAGRAIPGGRLRIAPLEDTPAQAARSGHEIGEVVYEGPNVMMGYAEDRADLALGDLLAGTLWTGDIGYLDDEGYLFLTGRTKRIAKVWGLRVNLEEVELLLREHGPAAVVAEDDRICGYCEFGLEASLLHLQATLSERLHLPPNSLQLIRVESLPITSSGKIDYHQLSRWMGGQPATTSAGVPVAEPTPAKEDDR